MYKKIILLTLLFSPVASLAVNWDNDSGNQLWNEPNNWDANLVPDGLQYVYIYGALGATVGPIVETGVNTDFTGMRFYIYGDPGNPGMDLTLTGGSLTNIHRVYVGKNGGTGTLNISDGAYLSTTASFYLGNGGPGNLNMTGGTIHIIGSFAVGYGTDIGTAHLDGGVVQNIGILVMYIPGSTIDITGGRMELVGNQVSTVNDHIAANKISGYGYFDTDHVIVGYDIGSNTTIVTAVSDDELYMAKNPIPPDLQINTPTNVELSWSPGTTAVSHDVYIGTNQTDVNNATNVSSEFKGNQPGMTYLPVLDVNTVYYWRIDEIDGSSNVYKGYIWQFTTSANPACEITAADGDTNGDCIINLADLSTVAENWLKCGLEPVAACS